MKRPWIVKAALLAALVAAALAARALHAARHPILAAQETRYVLLAESLSKGAGFTTPGSRYPDTMQPPLFPLLAAAGSILTGSPETGSRGVSILLGALTLVPIYRLGRRLAGWDAGFLGAAIAALHPGLIANSAVALTEATYVFCLLAGLAAAVASLSRPSSPGRSMTAAALLAFAYLTRPEGLVHVLIFLGLLAWAARRGAMRAVRPPGAEALAAAPRAGSTAGAAPAPRRAAWIPVAGAALAALVPVVTYVGWLRAASGVWSLAPKGAYAMALAARREAAEREGVNLVEGRLYEKIRFELDESGRDFRVKPGLGAGASGERPSLGFLARFAARNLAASLGLMAFSLDVVPPAVAVLALLGISRAVRRRRGFAAGYILVTFAGSFAFVLTHVLKRFTLPGAALLVPLAGAGAAWAASRAVRAAPDAGRRLSRAVAAAIVAVACAASMAPQLLALEGPGPPADAHLARAGAWIREHASSTPTVAAVTEVAAYYAGGRYIPIPFGPAGPALRFAREQGAQFLVLERNQTKALRPSLAPLLEQPAGSQAGAGGWSVVWSDPSAPPYRVTVLSPDEPPPEMAPASEEE